MSAILRDATCQFPVDPADLQTVFTLLSSEAHNVNPQEYQNILKVIWDLRHLPDCRPRNFSVTFLNKIGPDPEDGSSGSEWVSIDGTGESLEFSTGGHVYDPAVGGDSFSEAVFECVSSGSSRGELSEWVNQLECLDRDAMKISVDCEQLFPWSTAV